MEKKYWKLGFPPYQGILPGLIFENRKEAQERAKLENQMGEYKGRGVKVYPCNERGIIFIK